MKSVILAQSAAIAVIGALGMFGCGAEAGQPPTAAVAAQPAPTSSTITPSVPTAGPESDAVALPASEGRSLPATQRPPESQTLEDSLEAIDMPMTSIMSGEFPVEEEMPEPTMDSAPDSADSREVGGGAISALPTPGVVDDQGNLRQPEPGAALIDFTLPRAGGGEITLSEIGRDQNTVLVFYRAFW